MSQHSERAKLAGIGMSLQASAVAGAAADTNIAVTGIKLGDIIVAAFELQPPTAGSGNAVKSTLTSEIKLLSDGDIQCDTTNTTGNQILLLWIAVGR
jgi:hypothetical protein